MQRFVVPRGSAVAGGRFVSDPTVASRGHRPLPQINKHNTRDLMRLRPHLRLLFSKPDRVQRRRHRRFQ
jgi:hypothetical protein